ncbi:MAG: type II toxin-antitoxin system prevent-host-death family antitoxin [Parcubacteria group bacterium]|nr:type II toxin-antitoxin system prevent-host-death family antitoxin [Parcubacteria group bacterium]MBI4217473.1 type II toxin-antitoxin system prevent-host-death family antitoxin [Parcubacteria group bacterium]
MDLKDLKYLIRNGERVIIVENGNPTLVVLSFEEYSRPREQEELHIDSPPPEEEFTLDDLPLE